ncbi:MAG: glycosyl hydrolase-related protein, partial [Clostridiales bacterium]|nr:glycosyl hydrolase-related protein [Clostridiales bacterium]
RGLREYEVKDDKDRTIAITLLRTHRAYMTANSIMTPDEFDKYTGLQCFGDFEYSYAIYPHTGDWDVGGVMEAAYKHKVGIKAMQGVPVKGQLPETGSFFKINPEKKVMISALKKSEDGSGIVIRLWNTGSERLDVSITPLLPVHSVKSINLDESELSDVEVDNGIIRFEMGPHKIHSMLIKQKREDG